MQADGPADNPGRGALCLFLFNRGRRPAGLGGVRRGLEGGVQLQVVLSLAAEQALGWPSRISTRDRAKVLGLGLFWTPGQDAHNPPTASEFVCVLFSH